MAYASLQAMSPEPAAMMESSEVQDDPSSSSPSQPQENVPQSPLAVQAGPSTATGPAARYVPLVLGFALTPAFSHIRLCRFCTGCMAIVAQLLPPISSPAEYVHLCCVASCTYCKSFGMLYKFALDDLCTVQIRIPQIKMTSLTCRKPLLSSANTMSQINAGRDLSSKNPGKRKAPQAQSGNPFARAKVSKS